ncbi:MAG TPA: baseplate J/gp47 family protein [Pyrinomonadaceae bacterium]|nr:baseplate J/gp47 family protein [Pyrinomonadaceae bacterium]
MTTNNTCGCCELPDQTPVIAWNRPGLTSIVFRVGTYSSFRLSMLQRIAGTQALSDLKTRSDDDYAITLLDMWATVADVLTFYQERIANESFLRTAQQRDSILRMARMLDYHLRPGIAATTFLAFTLDKNSSVKIPVGLRVQSVPAENEQPQIFETLESILADSRLNSNRILPAPQAFNPLAKGSTSGLIAPGPEGLQVAAALSPGNQLVLVSGPQLEELTVREIRTEEERVTLRWSGPIQNTNWTFDSAPLAFNRKFRVFGNNTPSQYMEVQEPSTGVFVWVKRTIANADYSYTYPGGNILELDSKYEGISVGSKVLISPPNLLATVTAVSQGQAKFGAPGAAPAVQDTVTRLTISPAPVIADRRATVIYEITSPPIRFWGYRYPEKISDGRVLIPALRVDAETVEIGRTIDNKAFKPGVQLPIKSIEAGRKVILRDSTNEPVLAKVTSVAAIGLDVSFNTTPDDLTTAVQLRLTPEEAEQLSGLRSSPLPASITLTSSIRELSVTIGSLPARTITLASAPTTPSSAVTQLSNALKTSLPLVPEFAQVTVIPANNSLIVFPGVAGLPITFGPTADDTTTAAELGLVAPGAFRIDALLSGNLSPFPAITSVVRELLVTIGPIGPRTLALGPMPNLNVALAELALAIANAGSSPAFDRIMVTILPGTQRLLIVPGTGESSIRDYLELTLQPETPLLLDANTATLFGNVALSSHGEKVNDEVLGDGDASTAFQKFELQKTPLTYVPAAGPGGTESTLDVFVNDVLWTEVPSLFGQGPTDQVYISRLADDGKVTVGFGDGRTGSRLPSGVGNVVADYRQGAGLGGRVVAGSLRNPLDLPVGLKSATNPFTATGGADPESIDQARENAPTTVRTFGRAVSLRDFEDLARASGEVAKALATWVWNQEARAVHLTIAAQGGQIFSPSDLARIHGSLSTQRDPNHALFLDNYSEVPIVVIATVRVESRYVASKVAAAARQSLLAALSLDSLRFGQPVSLSDIYAVLQQVEGVSSVDIDRFHFKDQSPAFLAARGATTAPVQRTLRIFSARPNTVPMPPALPAELATVEAPVDDIQIVTTGGLPD